MCVGKGWGRVLALPAVLATAFDSLQLDQDTVAARQQAKGRREEGRRKEAPPPSWLDIWNQSRRRAIVESGPGMVHFISVSGMFTSFAAFAGFPLSPLIAGNAFRQRWMKTKLPISLWMRVASCDRCATCSSSDFQPSSLVNVYVCVCLSVCPRQAHPACCQDQQLNPAKAAAGQECKSNWNLTLQRVARTNEAKCIACKWHRNRGREGGEKGKGDRYKREDIARVRDREKGKLNWNGFIELQGMFNHLSFEWRCCTLHTSLEGTLPWQCNQLWYTHKSLLLQDCCASSYEQEEEEADYVNQLAQGNESQTKMPSKRKQFTLSDVLPHSRPSTHLYHPLPHPKQVGKNVISFSPSFQQANEANSAKQKPCKIMSMASLSCSFSCRHYRQLFPRSRQTETAQQIVTGRVRGRDYPPYRTMKVDAFVAYQNQNWIQKSHQKSIREHTATGSARDRHVVGRGKWKGEWGQM